MLPWPAGPALPRPTTGGRERSFQEGRVLFLTLKPDLIIMFCIPDSLALSYSLAFPIAEMGGVMVGGSPAIEIGMLAAGKLEVVGWLFTGSAPPHLHYFICLLLKTLALVLGS